MFITAWPRRRGCPNPGHAGSGGVFGCISTGNLGPIVEEGPPVGRAGRRGQHSPTTVQDRQIGPPSQVAGRRAAVAQHDRHVGVAGRGSLARRGALELAGLAGGRSWRHRDRRAGGWPAAWARWGSDGPPAAAARRWRMRVARAWPGVGRMGQRWAVRRMRHWPARPRGQLRQGLLAFACPRHRANRSPTGSGSVSPKSEPTSSCHSTARGPARLVALTVPAPDTTIGGRGFGSGSAPAVLTPTGGFRSKESLAPPPLRRCGIPQPHAARSRTAYHANHD
jgi:hypothetical protein